MTMAMETQQTEQAAPSLHQPHKRGYITRAMLSLVCLPGTLVLLLVVVLVPHWLITGTNFKQTLTRIFAMLLGTMP